MNSVTFDDRMNLSSTNLNICDSVPMLSRNDIQRHHNSYRGTVFNFNIIEVDSSFMNYIGNDEDGSSIIRRQIKRRINPEGVEMLGARLYY